MSLSPIPYSASSLQSPPALATPPPPPPKPSSHEASGRGTPIPNPHVRSPAPSTPPKEALAPREDAQTVAGDRNFASPSSSAQPPGRDDGWIPETLRDKSTNDLQSVLSEPLLLNALANTHPSYPASQSHLLALLHANKSLAAHALELESHLSSLRSSTETLLLQHQSLELSWRKKQTEMDTALAPWSPKALYQRLVAGIAEQEAVVRAVEESFLEGDLHHGVAGEREVVEWVRRVRSESAKLEMRREARARWDEGRVGGWR
ncbi:hypothetical protein LOZ12_001824 [Ophidiomyces ophidiicola]|uniref:Uncharacterized protein n=1 Tax=Ophidiomyces ophidiicola TaxID=1387563 RepID=A0ACB8V011_9EURO|nr:uncharacterized protein LOZ57_001775 [Ophidiomyces ophidiicola]KAI1917728.1 hypothetical protein LOZ61_000348 [Ophidiomyces ophidiicola]KAI1919408.1 hypothetical protein LOZ64_002332 [Ophidiomyces ophidiicola]KAI1928382.1 hypothetical protein LOZ60_002480 [Ophidiomyces ophidiicola]KAI1951221.1 hypothetical protein LOZ57_001775 [Ophidiomyces ophidiicola]KAI1953636.1 hypothetical protein LOZ62_000997 [Ophidiomyces ophidiicola]